MLVEVRPIERKTWHGKTKIEDFKRPIKLPALVDGRTMTYQTGLTDKDIEWLKSKDIQYDLSNNFNPDAPHPFWDSSLPLVKLENNTMFFDDTVPIEFIKIKIMKASKYVANSQMDYENGLYPEATHIIYDEAREQEVKASKIALKNQAIIASAKLSSVKKVQIILIISGKLLKGESDDKITVVMNDIIENNPTEVLKYIGMDAKEVAVEAMILECLERNILQRVGYKIKYHDSTLGTDVQDVIAYLENPENQDLKLRLMKLLAE